MKLKLKLSDGLCDQTQRYGFELDAAMRIMDYIMTSHKDDPTFLKTPLFMQYNADFELKNAEYEAAKTEMLCAVFGDVLPHINGAIIDWRLDYATGILDVTIADAYKDKFVVANAVVAE